MKRRPAKKFQPKSKPKPQHPLGFALPPRREEGGPRPGPSEEARSAGRRLARMMGPAERAPRQERRSPVAAPARENLHIASVELIARTTVEIAERVEKAVFEEKKRGDLAISFALRDRRDLGLADHRFISGAIMALFRWHGWVETLHLERIEERLMLSHLLDSPSVHPVVKAWANRLDIDATKLFALGGAPNWTARGEGWKRLHNGAPLNADPWRLFPQWLREHLPMPPGGGSSKMKWLELLNAFQAPAPLWCRVQGKEPKIIWNELTEAGLKPWIHRQINSAAKIERDADVHHLPAFERGELEIQDLASQVVGLICDPDPGERWWDACAGAGGKSLHLAGLMKGKGLVVASDVNERKLQEAVRRARRSPFRNLTTKPWDGKHVVGKAGKYDGVLVDAPCSGIGTWRRNPDARWLLDRDSIPRLAETQAQILKTCAAGVRPGGTLVYSVCTLTPLETQRVVQGFLAEHGQFKLDPFRNPINGEETDGTLQVWPQDADSDAMFIARMVKVGGG